MVFDIFQSASFLFYAQQNVDYSHLMYLKIWMVFFCAFCCPQKLQQQQDPGTQKWILLWIVYFGKIVSISFQLAFLPVIEHVMTLVCFCLEHI